ncbi:hypothetical protein BKA62DRAFT_617331, partial [Auriculariales sp. MPI-PUGE-AT-0066]
ISRSRLIKFCPALRAMLSLPQQQGVNYVELHNDPEDFRSFMWYMDVDPISFLAYRESPSSESKCRRLVGVAAVLHMYDNPKDARWILDWLFSLVETCERKFIPGINFVALHRTASRWAETDPPDAHERTPMTRARDLWCDMMAQQGTDPVAFLVAAKEQEDQYLQAHAYFYTLRLEHDVIAADKRLTVQDRQRLMIGLWSFRASGLETKPWKIPPQRPANPRGEGHYGTAGVGPVQQLRWISTSPPTPWRPRVDDRIINERDDLWKRFTEGPWSLE